MHYKSILVFCIIFTINYLHSANDKIDDSLSKLPNDIFLHIIGFLPANVFLLNLAHNSVIQITPDIASNIIRKFKNTAIQRLRNHDISPLHPNAIEITQPLDFINKKESFLRNLKTFFISCPQHNQRILHEVMQYEIKNRFENDQLQLPVDRFTVRSVNIPYL